MNCTACGAKVARKERQTSSGSGMLDNRWLLPLVLGGLTLAVIAFAAMPTLIVWSVGGFTSRTVLDSVSPEGRYRVAVARWAQFPANEFLDPSIVVAVMLTDAHAGETLDYMEIGLREASDLGNPKAEWAGTFVIVRDLDDAHGLSVTMNASAWKTE